MFCAKNKSAFYNINWLFGRRLWAVNRQYCIWEYEGNFVSGLFFFYRKRFIRTDDISSQISLKGASRDMLLYRIQIETTLMNKFNMCYKSILIDLVNQVPQIWTLKVSTFPQGEKKSKQKRIQCIIKYNNTACLSKTLSFSLWHATDCMPSTAK